MTPLITAPMRFLGLLAIALALASCQSPVTATYAGDDQIESFPQANFNRYYRIYVPERREPGPVAPLVLAFHGVGQNSKEMRASSGLDQAAEQYGFIVVYLQAAMGAWDVFGDLSELGLDEIGYVREVIDRVTARYVVDRHRIIAVGLSNGGVFSQRLGCVLSNRIVGFVSVAATMPHRLAEECQPDHRVSALYLVGTADTQFPIEGSNVLRSLDEAMDLWARVDGCDGRRERSAWPDLTADDTRVYWSRYKGCDGGTRVWLDSIVGGGHTWPDAAIPASPSWGPTSHDVSANAEIARFLDGLKQQ